MEENLMEEKIQEVQDKAYEVEIPQELKDYQREAYYQQGLSEASAHHQAFLEMTAVKGGFDPQLVSRHVEEAEMRYITLLNTYLHDEIILYQLATLYMQTNRNGLATALLREMADRDDARIEWLNNIGAAYRNEHDNERARLYFERALGKDYHPDVLANLCALWVNEGFPERGIPYGRECVRLSPSHNQGNWNLGLLLLEDKQYEEGFKKYSEGFFTGERIVRHYKDKDGNPSRFWLGEDLNGKSIVIHGEQGIGDELLFLQFLPFLKEKYPEAKIILDCHPRLHTMIQRSYPWLEDVFPTRKTNPDWNNYIPVDYKDGLGSLPRWFHKERRKNSGWLKPDENLVKKYTRILNKLKEETGKVGKPIVGLAWTGGKKKTRHDLRSLKLEELLPVLEQDCIFVSLEYPEGAEKATGELLAKKGIHIHHWPDVTENFDYEHSVALAAACDLVISVNTSIVHVCGSLDQMCWTLTPHGHAWRYGKKDKINPFYNSVVQYHQNCEDNGWERVVRKVKDDLYGYVKRYKEEGK